MAKKLKVIGINLVVFAVLVFGANLIASIWLDTHRTSIGDGSSDSRASLPAYPDHDHARMIFHDFYRTKLAYSPFEAARVVPFSSPTVNINSDGLRVVKHAAVAANAPFVRFFGGSTMWGTGVDDAHTIPQLVQMQFPDMYVANYGQQGFVSRQNVAALLKIISSGGPLGTVIFYDGVNDVFIFCKERTTLSGHSLESLYRELVANYVATRGRPPSYTWNATLGSLYALIRGAPEKRTLDVADIPSDRCSSDPKAIEEIAERMWRNWLAAKALTESFGGKFIAILQPVSSVGNPDREYLPPTPTWDAWYRKAYAALRAKISDATPWAHDLSKAYDNVGPVYIDWAHVSERGNAIIADHISLLLRKARN